MSIVECIRIHEKDTVAVAVRRLSAGEWVTAGENRIQVLQDIPSGHKFALADMAAEAPIIKYGESIGHATDSIRRGEWVHTHNVRTGLSGVKDYRYRYEGTEDSPPPTEITFQGYPRGDGQVGIRNEIWVIPAVGCVNKICERLVRLFERDERLGLTDGVFTFPHPYGCSQMGGDHLLTQKYLAGLAHHPNAGGILIVHLGCENNQPEQLREVLGPHDAERIRFLTVQDVEDEYETGLAILGELADHVAGFRREAVPVSKLKIGLKCGGSDGFSGITANSLLGRVSDMIVAAGGSSVLTEVPEMFGAEHLLMKRCVSPEIFEKCVGMVNGFKEYYLRNGQNVYENPSPGNKQGGITTLEDKSLGCVQKGGSAPVVDVLQMGERLSRSGLNLLSGPGNDMVSITTLAVSGVHMILFSTGRGTPLGSPVPTVKVSSNSEGSRKKSHWIDYDAGKLLAGQGMNEVARDFFGYLLEVASGTRRTRSEEHGFREIAIFKDGVTL